ncbi:hypothetical protein D3C80_899680 [compost metagenome]
MTICRAAATATPSRSFRVSIRPTSARRWLSLRSVFSTTTTAPSTRRPKSSAPRLIKFPLIPKRFMPMTANRKLIGIIRAAMVAARILPSSRNRTTMTSSAPSVRLRATVEMVALTRALRSRTVTASIPTGRVLRTCSRRSPAAWATVRLLPPAIIRAVPRTASWPSRLAPPRRGAWPTSTVATSATRTTRPLRLTTGAWARSSTVEARASVRTVKASPARWT